jgi:N-acetylglucosamine kinase-like BadF-type ATPase
MTLVLGVDGGNTKTVALVARGDGTVVGSGRAGCADVYGAESPEAAIEAVTSAVADALRAAGAQGGDLDAAVFCLAGADWPEDFALHHRELTSRIGLRRTATVFNDAIATLRAGTPDAVGVAAVVGTGGAIAGRNARGETWHLGFWPDGMAAGGIARAALRAVYRSGLGLDQPTSLVGRACALYGVMDVIELLHRFSRRGPKPASAALVPVVFEEAAAGDGVARAIIETDASRFADAVRTTAFHLALETPFPLVLAGGVLRHAEASLHADAIAAAVPGAVTVRAGWEPVVGALLLAYDEAEAEPDVETLRTSLPSVAFFATRLDP